MSLFFFIQTNNSEICILVLWTCMYECVHVAAYARFVLSFTPFLIALLFFL